MDSNMLSPTSRFSYRAANYTRYRPGYPGGIIPYLQQAIGLKKDNHIADIGSGTGIFSSLFLQSGYGVKAVEPNEKMRITAEERLKRFPGFESINGTAENTGIEEHSIDLITVAQAFHWFEPIAVKKEFSRILKPAGHTLLIWNILFDNTPFLAAYHKIKKEYAADLKHTHRANLSSIEAFFRPAAVITRNFQHTQLLKKEEFKGYFLSFSTVPLPGSPSYNPMMEEMDRLFLQYEKNGYVKMDYETKLYLSQQPAG
jgi:ubiquinone/menaquinone biosynthesis C-methylase UbiE